MKYALKKARRIRIYDIQNGEHKVTLNDLKTVTVTNGQETVYAEGSDGARLAGWDNKKTSTIKATNGAIETGYIALAVGDEDKKVVGCTGISIREEAKVTSGKTVVLAHKASGSAGSEIKFIYVPDVNGNPSTDGDGKIPQVAEAVTDKAAFTYDASTKTITLNDKAFALAGEGKTVIVDYYPTFSEAHAIANDANKFSITGKVIIDAWFTDLCSQADVPLQIVLDRGKISGAMEFEFGDNAAVQNLEVEGMAGACASSSRNLWTLYDYDMNKIDDGVEAAG